MNIKKIVIPLTTAILVCFLATLLLLALLCTDQSIWFANVFLDKVYVFELAPLYLIGIAYINRQMTTPTIIRIGKRRKALFISLSRKWGFAFAYICTWFTFVNLIICIKFTYLYEKGALDIISKFLRYLLGLIMLSIITEIFSRSQNKHLSGNSYLCTNLILALEVIAIVPEIRANTHFKLYLVFSWIFSEDIWGYVVRMTIIAMLLLYLLKISVKKDML